MKTGTIITAFIMLYFFTGVRAQTLKDAMKYMDNEQYEKAGAMLKKLVAAEPNNGDNYFWYGENYYKTDNLDSAKMMYDLGLKKNPSNALCMAGNGKILLLQGKADEAKKLFYNAGVVLGDKTGKLGNQLKAVVCLKIAEAFMAGEHKDTDEATKWINKAAIYDQSNSAVNILMGDVLYEKNPVNSSDAIAEYKRAIEKDKSSPVPLFKKGELYLKAKNPEAAQAELDNALKIDSMFAPAWRLKGDAFYYRNQLDKATAAYKKYLSINNGNISARVRYVAFLFLAKKYPECIAESKQLQKEGCANNLLNRLVAFSYYETGDCAAGISTLDQYFPRQPPEKIIELDYEYYAKMQQKCNKDSLAVIWFKKALAKDSTKTDLWSDIANIYKKAKRYPEAIQAYKTKIARGGRNVTVNDYFFLGQMYYYNNEFGKADSAFMKYCEVQKDIYYGYFWRGRCNAAMDPESKTWQARPFYEQAVLKSKPEDSKKDLEEAYFYMGFYYFSQKDYANAKCCYLKIKEFNLGSEKFKNAVKALEGPELKNITPAPDCIKQ